jgi:2'-5' RNA ligase
MRLFVALRLDPELHTAVEVLRDRLQEFDRALQVRWVESQSIHLTLKFLDEVEADRVPELQDRLDQVLSGHRAPSLALSHLGAFPNLRRPRVLWVGLAEQGEALLPLQSSLDAATAALGWEPERRAYQPHLTLGRVREIRGRDSLPVPPALLEALAAGTTLASGFRPQTRVALMRSHLAPSGAHYEEMHAWELSAGRH